MPIRMNLSVALMKKQLSLSELAKKVDITLPNLSRIKTGRAKALRLSTLEALCEALDSTPGALMDYLPRAPKTKAALTAMDPSRRYDYYISLGDAAQAAFEEKAPARAKALAEELLRLAPENKKDWNYGNALHHGHRILGLVALGAGDVKGAEARLLKSGATPGSPQLNSFGPEFDLAKALYERGRTATVLRYLALCSAFWKSDFGCLEKWRQQIAAGIPPNFRQNG
ncbi:MAG: RNA polymerase, sigma-24 subunit, ECF subfamily-like hypothetical protein [Elusimicrobia bacterium]|nr:MAG: RNA polymerase, sigma-24 subunit, ECF subfamily-like hypothetical protein [Elusimicrobiota bacterium]